MGKILHHLLLPGESEFREVIDEKGRRTSLAGDADMIFIGNNAPPIFSIETVQNVDYLKVLLVSNERLLHYNAGTGETVAIPNANIISQIPEIATGNGNSIYFMIPVGYALYYDTELNTFAVTQAVPHGAIVLAYYAGGYNAGGVWVSNEKGAAAPDTYYRFYIGEDGRLYAIATQQVDMYFTLESGRLVQHTN
jgi:hypothetical protein